MNGVLFKLGYNFRIYLAFAIIFISFLAVWIFFEKDSGFLGIHPRGFAFIFSIIGIFIPILIIRTVRCPKCNYQILWKFFNNPKSFPQGYSPFHSSECSNCGYRPEKQ